MLETVTDVIVLQAASPLVREVSTGTALLMALMFGAITLLTMALRSALAMLTWGLTGVFLTLWYLQIVPIEFLLMVIVIAYLSIAATAIHTARNA